MAVRVELVKEFRFEAAHRLPRVPADHKCARLHGHSYRLEVRIAGEVDEAQGWLIGYGTIKTAVAPILAEHLDHYYLNEVAGLDNPTCENLARWLWRRLAPRLPLLAEIVIAETCESRCHYRGEE